PASITMRPILRPKVRVSVDWPSRVGSAALAGWIKSGLAPTDFAFFDRDFPLVLATRLELRGAGIVGLELAGPLAAALAAGAGGPNGSTLVAAVDTGCTPAPSSRVAAE